ncbi:hypothetical protein BDEG_23457 [Batrachochytrium dendrobatidis JEL423]|uniref:Lebercilin domain-containing protein n=1 Tax=Batrachochytrium dendrobatidis (strain JEL423) TaxID=403673 RepID=A0A177WIU7_BATDL|nr:hypothetical protein BDEG_23457 [Batrachochytrium dendrobatidis JEL423]
MNNNPNDDMDAFFSSRPSSHIDDIQPIKNEPNSSILPSTRPKSPRCIQRNITDLTSETHKEAKSVNTKNYTADVLDNTSAKPPTLMAYRPTTSSHIDTSPTEESQETNKHESSTQKQHVLQPSITFKSCINKTPPLHRKQKFGKSSETPKESQGAQFRLARSTQSSKQEIPIQIDNLSKKPVKKHKLDFAHTASESLSEMTRLMQIIDEQKVFISQLRAEQRTLNIVNLRQEKAIQKSDRDRGDMPRVIHAMNEELRVAKIEKSRHMDKISHLQKKTQHQAQEIHRLQNKCNVLHDQILIGKTMDILTLQKQLEQHQAIIEKSKEMNLILERQVRQLEGERDREVAFTKSSVSKLMTELNQAHSEITGLKQKRHDLDRQSMAMSNRSPSRLSPTLYVDDSCKFESIRHHPSKTAASSRNHGHFEHSRGTPLPQLSNHVALCEPVAPKSFSHKKSLRTTRSLLLPLAKESECKYIVPQTLQVSVNHTESSNLLGPNSDIYKPSLKTQATNQVDNFSEPAQHIVSISQNTIHKPAVLTKSQMGVKQPTQLISISNAETLIGATSQNLQIAQTPTIDSPNTRQTSSLQEKKTTDKFVSSNAYNYDIPSIPTSPNTNLQKLPKTMHSQTTTHLEKTDLNSEAIYVAETLSNYSDDFS